MKIVAIGILAFPIAVTIASSAAHAQTTPQTFTYRCDAGRSFQAEFSPASARLIVSRSESYTLPQVTAASGIQYSDGRTTLYSQEEEAFIEVDGQRVYNNCVATTDMPSLTAPETTISAAPASTVIAYRCEDEQTFAAAYRPESVELTLFEQTFTLPRVQTASGIRYSDGQTTLASRENEALIEVNGVAVYQDCIAQSTTTTGQVTTRQTLPIEGSTRQATLTQTPTTVTPIPVRPVNPAPVRALW